VERGRPLSTVLISPLARGGFVNRILRIIFLLAVLPNMAYAGYGTIRETDSQIIVEYTGDVNEVIAANIIKDKEEKLQEQEEKVKTKEVARIINLSENHAKLTEKRRAKYNEGSED
jgi:hypothetical protein